MELNFKDKTVLITGGAQGIGENLVENFNATGATVYFCDIDKDRGEKLKDRLKGKVLFEALDIKEGNALRTWVESCGEKESRIDILINNAAIDHRIDFHEATEDDWDEFHDTNLKSMFITCRYSLPFLTEGSSIVNISSITYQLGVENLSLYTAGKAGVVGFTRSLARSLGKKKIRANVVSPGWVATERQLRDYLNTPEMVEFAQGQQCLHEFLTPQEITNTIMFLASDLASGITGQNISVNKGWYLG